MIRLPDQTRLCVERQTGSGAGLHAAVLARGGLRTPEGPRRGLVRPVQQSVTDQHEWSALTDRRVAQLLHLHAGVGTPEDWLVTYLAHGIAADRRHGVRRAANGVCFDPEASYRGALFGTAIVTLMLTADARIHEILQISADRFVRPGRVYIVKNPDGTPKRDPSTNQIVTDVIVEQRLLPKGRKGVGRNGQVGPP
jgi:hypothetical protein